MLPAPKNTNTNIDIIEENDEFLKKKAIPTEKPPAKVKIMIPSLSEFKDVDDQTLKKSSNQTDLRSNKPGSLLSLLPKPKSEHFTQTKNPTINSEKVEIKKNTFLIPESVKKATSIKNTKDSLAAKKEDILAGLKKTVISDGEDSDEDTDFFSLEKEVVLPKVNLKEIDEMVAKRAAQMAEAFKPPEKMEDTSNEIHMESNTFRIENRAPIDKTEAIKMLSGHKEAKRRKTEDIQFIEISDDQVMPSRSEWYRTALASSTTYQRRGMVDEEAQPGTRRKNQITYLANQALANDSELQAMWSENRANRRATQNKYGF